MMIRNRKARIPHGVFALAWLADRDASVAVLMKEQFPSEEFGFFDESGIHDGAKITVVAGWVAPIEEWLTFERQWKLVLKKEDVKAFRFADFDNCKGEYAGWSAPRKIQFIKEIFKVIDSRDLRGFSGGVHIPEFKSVVAGSNTKLEEKSSPYIICQQYCVEMISKKIPKTIHYVFDQQVEFDHPARCNYFDTREKFTEWRDKMGGISYESKEKFVQLQAADLLAYETAKSLYNRFFRPDLPIRKSMAALVRKPGRLIGGLIREDGSRHILEWQKASNDAKKNEAAEGIEKENASHDAGRISWPIK